MDPLHAFLICHVQALASLSNLVHLNLHGNQIEDVREVEPLSTLSRLRRFTLHANPCAARPLYRETVLTILPWLCHLDFTGVTKGDRASAEEWYKMHGKKKVMTADEMQKLVADQYFEAELARERANTECDSSDPEEIDDDGKIDPAEEKAALRRQQKKEDTFTMFD